MHCARPAFIDAAKANLTGECMKQRYRNWHLPVLSFYSRRLYRDVSTRWKGANLGFLFLLLAVCFLPAARNASRGAERIIDQKADIFLMQIPPMRFSNGKLSVDAPQPYSIIEGNRTVLLIDTTGKIQTLDDAGAAALLTETHLYIRQKNKPPLAFALAEFGELEISRGIAELVVERAKGFFLPAFYVAGYLVNLVLFTLAALLFGAIARLFASIQKRSVDYRAGLRLSMVALTPVLIICGLLETVERSVPPVLYLLLALAYLYMAVGCARRMRPADPHLDDGPA